MATVKELKATLTAAGVEIPEGARKADLVELVDAVVGEDTPTVQAGGIDPRLVEVRDATAAREGRPPKVRPVPAGLDPRLVEVRDATVAADARNRARPATAPPAR